MKEYRRAPVLSTQELEQAVRDVAEYSTEPVAIAGGYAMQLYGSDRFTKDLDIISESQLPEAQFHAGKDLSFGGYQSTTPSGVPVDVIMRDDEYEGLYVAALETAQNVRGVPLQVVRPVYLAAMKLAAGRKKDEADLEWLIDNFDLDIVETRKVIKTFLGEYAAREFTQLVSLSTWRKSQQ